MNVKAIPLKKRIALELYALKRALDSRVHELRYLFWECTLRCNLSCMHCGSDCLSDSAVADMPREDFLKVIDRIRPHVDPHKTMIAITGGEPLMRPDLEECGKELYARGFPWGMVTNGYALTASRLAGLLDAGLRSVTVSLDGLESSHDWFRSRSGSFSRALDAIKMVAATPSLVHDVVTCVHQRNFGELEQIKELLLQAGVRRWRLFTVFPKGRAKLEPLLKLDDAQFAGMFSFIKQTRAEGKLATSYGCEGFLGALEGEVRDALFSCHAGVSIGSVLIDGSISACPSLRADYIQGSIYRDDFWDVWNNRFDIMRNRSWTKSGECADCAVYRYCKGNGLHLRDESSGELLLCHYKKLCAAAGQ
jgi:radical SAM enzyme (rSAM/lipoprotein system)